MRFKGLRHNYIAHGLVPGHTKRAPGFHLPFIDGLDACAENFGNVCTAVNGAGADSRKNGSMRCPIMVGSAKYTRKICTKSGVPRIKST